MSFSSFLENDLKLLIFCCTLILFAGRETFRVKIEKERRTKMSTDEAQNATHKYNPRDEKEEEEPKRTAP